MSIGCQIRTNVSLPFQLEGMSESASKVDQDEKYEEKQKQCFKRKISTLKGNVALKIKNKYARKSLPPNRDGFNNIALQWKHSVKLLESKSIDIEHINSYQKHTGNDVPMIWAAKNNQLDILQALIYVGGDVYIMDAKGNTPLSYAVFGNHQEAIDLLKTKLHFYEYSKSN